MMSSAEMSDDCGSKFTTLVRGRDIVSAQGPCCDTVILAAPVDYSDP